jgi:hypothetical protein
MLDDVNVIVMNFHIAIVAMSKRFPPKCLVRIGRYSVDKDMYLTQVPVALASPQSLGIEVRPTPRNGIGVEYVSPP